MKEKSSAVTLSAAAEGLFQAHSGRDRNLPARVHFWVETIGPEHLLASISPDDVERAILVLRRRGVMRRTHAGILVLTGNPLTSATVNRYVNAFLTLWRISAKLGFVSRSVKCPASGFIEPEGEGRTRFLTAEEFKRLRMWAAASKWKRLETLVVLAVTTGLRAGSLTNLRWRDVDIAKMTLTVERTKNGRPQVSVLTPLACELLKGIAGQRCDADHFVFRGRYADRPHCWRKAFETARRQAGLDDGEVTFHTLRHTAASWAAQAGHSALEIAALTGHSSLVSLRRYTHLDVTSLRKLSSGV